MENQTQSAVPQAVDVFYKAPSVLITGTLIKIGRTHLATHMVAEVNVRRRRGLYFGWLALGCLLIFVYGLLHLRQISMWDSSAIFLGRFGAWGLCLIVFLGFIFALHFALFPPFALYLEIAEQGHEKEIVVRTSLKPHELRKMAVAIEKAVDWDYSPRKTF